MISSTLMEHNHIAKVLFPCSDNTSDHLSVSAAIDYTLKSQGHITPKHANQSEYQERSSHSTSPRINEEVWKRKFSNPNYTIQTNSYETLVEQWTFTSPENSTTHVQWMAWPKLSEESWQHHIQSLPNGKEKIPNTREIVQEPRNSWTLHWHWKIKTAQT